MKTNRKASRNNPQSLAGKTFTGVYHFKRGSGWVEPDGSGNTDIVIFRGRDGGAKNGDRVEFEVTGQRHRKGSYEGRILKVFDPERTFLAEQALFPEKHKLRRQFPPQAKKSAGLPSQKPRGYRDLRGYPCITIDPPDAKDFDDAISLECSKEGYRLGVYIADVSAFVLPGSALDKEAYLRGTSTYFPWGVVPMLPPSLSEELCSLKPGEERRAVACVMDLDKTGKLIKTDIFKCLIINKQRLTYRDAQEILDGKLKPSGEHGKMLLEMQGLSRVLRQKRLDEGSLDFDLPEVKIDFQGGRIPMGVRPYEKYETNRLVEEFMLLANQAVAMRLTDMERDAIYRIHGKPEDTAIQAIYAFAKANDLKVSPYEGMHSFKQILDLARGTSIEKPVHTMVLRAMPKARYTTHNIGHFGLGFELYTHFTSPIRRYPDLLVHRLLFEGKVIPKQKTKRSDLEKVCEACSEAEERSMKAERDAVSLCSCTVMRCRQGEVFDGHISGIIEAGVFVELPGQGVDGMVHVSKLGRDYFYFDPASLCMVGRSSGKRIRLGDAMRVRIQEVSISLRRIDLVPLEEQ